MPGLQPVGDEVCIINTTDSALAGTNVRLILHNIWICNVVCDAILADQRVLPSVRGPAGESFKAIVLAGGGAAGFEDPHHREFEIIDIICCHVMFSAERRETMNP